MITGNIFKPQYVNKILNAHNIWGFETKPTRKS